jgi:hypothetical protein
MRFGRRQFLARGGAFIGALTITGWRPGAAGAAEAEGVAPVTGAIGLTDVRRQTYRSLVETVVTEPAMRLDAAAADTAASQFTAAYTTWPAELQQRADRILDALDQSAGRPLHRLDRDARAAHLRACARPSSDQPVGAERRQLDLAEHAVSLAAVAVGPSGGELDRPLDSV